MEEYIGLNSENEERDRLPISPIAFGSGKKMLSVGSGHLVFCVKEGSAMLCGVPGFRRFCIL